MENYYYVVLHAYIYIIFVINDLTSLTHTFYIYNQYKYWIYSSGCKIFYKIVCDKVK